MAFSPSSGDASEQQAEINMIPLIDVMLVLLVIFIVTAPLLVHSVRIDLPQASHQPVTETPEAITLTITSEGALYWNNEALSVEEYEARLAPLAQQSPLPELRIRADAEVDYQHVAKAMAAAAKRGLSRISLLMQPNTGG